MDWTRRRIQRSPLKKVALALGVNAGAKWAYERMILAKRRHTADILGHRLTFKVTSRKEIFAINDLYGEHEFLQRLMDSSGSGDVLYDVGANIGIVAILLADRHRGASFHAHGFEPEPLNFQHLKDNIALNGLGGQATPHRLGLGSRTGKVRLFIGGEAGTGQHTIVAETAAGREAVEIDLVSGDDFAKGHPAPDILKVDVEGAEMEVLLGCEELLRNRRIREVFVEIHLGRIFTKGFGSEDDVVKWLTDRGMELVWRQQRGGEVLTHFRRRG